MRHLALPRYNDAISRDCVTLTSSLLYVENLAWVHQAVWVQGLLDRSHQLQRTLPQLGLKERLFPHSNSMFSLEKSDCISIKAIR